MEARVGFDPTPPGIWAAGEERISVGSGGMPAMPIKVEPANDLKAEEREIERRATDNLQQNLPGLVEEYRKKYGSEISTDNARDIVSPEYAESAEGATRWSRATQRPAGALADYLYEDSLRNPDASKPRVVVFTSGGTGAGKTTALRQNSDLARDARFLFDSNLVSKKSSLQKIDAARAAGNEVRIVHVIRDPVDALAGGVLPRAMDEGRVVDLDAHARMYRDSAENLRYLARRYAGDPGVKIRAIDNRGQTARVVPLDVAYGIRYSTSDLLPKLRSALETEYVQGRISEQVYRATLGASSPETSGGVPRDLGPGSPEASGRGASARSARGHDSGVHGGESEPQRAGQKGSQGPGGLSAAQRGPESTRKYSIAKTAPAGESPTKTNHDSNASSSQ